MHHYTYWLTCQDTNEHYIGARTSKIQPELDHYWSSSKVVRAMMRDGKKFTKQVLAEWDTREEAILHEVLLHDIFDVARNTKFLNMAKQTCTSFDTTGTVGVSKGSDKQKAAVALANKTRKQSEKYKSTRIFGKYTRTPEQRLAASIRMRGNNNRTKNKQEI